MKEHNSLLDNVTVSLNLVDSRQPALGKYSKSSGGAFQHIKKNDIGRVNSNRGGMPLKISNFILQVYSKPMKMR
jgi:hypothetical protein